MDRRILMLALAGGASMAAAPLLAQSTPSTMSGPAETEHAKETGAAGAGSLQASEIALGKATDPKVKQFALFEHDEQTTVAEIIKAMFPSMPANPGTDMTDAISRLRSMQAGKGFDAAFVTAQIEGHEKLLAIQDKYLAVGKDLPTIAVTKLVRGMVKEHLAVLADLKKMVG